MIVKLRPRTSDGVGAFGIRADQVSLSGLDLPATQSPHTIRGAGA